MGDMIMNDLNASLQELESSLTALRARHPDIDDELYLSSAADDKENFVSSNSLNSSGATPEDHGTSASKQIGHSRSVEYPAGAVRKVTPSTLHDGTSLIGGQKVEGEHNRANTMPADALGEGFRNPEVRQTLARQVAEALGEEEVTNHFDFPSSEEQGSKKNFYSLPVERGPSLMSMVGISTFPSFPNSSSSSTSAANPKTLQVGGSGSTPRIVNNAILPSSNINSSWWTNVISPGKRRSPEKANETTSGVYTMAGATVFSADFSSMSNSVDKQSVIDQPNNSSPPRRKANNEIVTQEIEVNVMTDSAVKEGGVIEMEVDGADHDPLSRTVQVDRVAEFYNTDESILDVNHSEENQLRNIVERVSLSSPEDERSPRILTSTKNKNNCSRSLEFLLGIQQVDQNGLQNEEDVLEVVDSEIPMMTRPSPVENINAMTHDKDNMANMASPNVVVVSSTSSSMISPAKSPVRNWNNYATGVWNVSPPPKVGGETLKAIEEQLSGAIFSSEDYRISWKSPEKEEKKEEQVEVDAPVIYHQSSTSTSTAVVRKKKLRGAKNNVYDSVGSQSMVCLPTMVTNNKNKSTSKSNVVVPPVVVPKVYSSVDFTEALKATSAASNQQMKAVLAWTSLGDCESESGISSSASPSKRFYKHKKAVKSKKSSNTSSPKKSRNSNVIKTIVEDHTHNTIINNVLKNDEKQVVIHHPVVSSNEERSNNKVTIPFADNTNMKETQQQGVDVVASSTNNSFLGNNSNVNGAPPAVSTSLVITSPREDNIDNLHDLDVTPTINIITEKMLPVPQNSPAFTELMITSPKSDVEDNFDKKEDDTMLFEEEEAFDCMKQTQITFKKLFNKNMHMRNNRSIVISPEHNDNCKDENNNQNKLNTTTTTVKASPSARKSPITNNNNDYNSTQQVIIHQLDASVDDEWCPEVVAPQRSSSTSASPSKTRTTSGNNYLHTSNEVVFLKSRGRPRTVICDLCDKEFFPSSFSFHYAICQRKHGFDQQNMTRQNNTNKSFNYSPSKRNNKQGGDTSAIMSSSAASAIWRQSMSNAKSRENSRNRSMIVPETMTDIRLQKAKERREMLNNAQNMMLQNKAKQNENKRSHIQRVKKEMVHMARAGSVPGRRGRNNEAWFTRK